jgi:hypothetical protein
MDRRKFLNSLSAASLATVAGAATISEKADALEDAMSAELDKRRAKPKACYTGEEYSFGGGSEGDNRPFFQHHDPALPEMPKEPTLMDFFKLRFAPASHVLQSARLAKINGHNETIITACLLHDIGLELMNTDHGYWCAQMIRPYVSEEIAWAIEKHQALRFFPDESVGYEYPQAYIRMFGADYQVEPYIEQEYKKARNHKWYMTSRLITINDLYSFDPDIEVDVEDFTDIMGRNFKQPKGGLGFDGSPVAHMWRTMIWPNNVL